MVSQHTKIMLKGLKHVEMGSLNRKTMSYLRQNDFLKNKMKKGAIKAVKHWDFTNGNQDTVRNANPTLKYVTPTQTELQ